MSAEDWTPDRVGLLKVLWAQGFSCSQIARQLGGGVTRNAVIGKRIRLGLPDRAMPSARSRLGRKPAPQCAPRPRLIAPKLKPEPPRKPRSPARGPNAVAFIERSPSQCPMFCAGEELSRGFVCGEKVEAGETWCSSCKAIAYLPVRVREAA